MNTLFTAAFLEGTMKILIVDGNNTIARCQNAFPKARTTDGFPVGGLYGSLNMVRMFLARNPHDACVVASDWGSPAFRKTVCPEYKGQREAKRTPEQEMIWKDYKRQVPIIHKVFVPAGVSSIRAKDWEGDDVIAALVLHRFRKHTCTIMSSDRDFLQLVDGKRVQMWDLHRDEYRNPEPNFCLKRCLDPKDSDNLDGVAGIGPKKADDLVNAWYAAQPDIPSSPTYLDNFIAWCKAQPQTRLDSKKQVKPTIHALVVVGQQKVRANWKCTYLPGTAKQCSSELKFRHGKKDFVAFRQVCRELQLTPILTDMSAIWPAYNRLKQATGA